MRNSTLDVFRGFAIITMILVDSPPDFESFPSILKHSLWNGITIADLAFPAFVFAMGISVNFSSSKTMFQICRRTLILFILGLIFNLLPDIFQLQLNLDNLRILGVLQRLSLTYFCGMIILRFIATFKRISTVCLILLLISSAGFHLTSFDELHNISRSVDLYLLGTNHLYQFYGFAFDPENLFGTVASTATMLIGYLTGKLLNNNRQLIFIGTVLMILGYFWSFFDIISKPLWTAPFVLITSAVNIFLLVLLNLSRFNWIFEPIMSLGRNAILFYFLTNATLIFLWTVQIDSSPAYVWIYHQSNLNSLVFSIIWCVIWIISSIFLYKRRIIVKI